MSLLSEYTLDDIIASDSLKEDGFFEITQPFIDITRKTMYFNGWMKVQFHKVNNKKLHMNDYSKYVSYKYIPDMHMLWIRTTTDGDCIEITNIRSLTELRHYLSLEYLYTTNFFDTW